MAASIIDIDYCVATPLPFSLPPPLSLSLCLFLRRLNNGSFVRSIIIPASTLLSATRVRLVEDGLKLFRSGAIKESAEKGY